MSGGVCSTSCAVLYLCSLRTPFSVLYLCSLRPPFSSSLLGSGPVSRLDRGSYYERREGKVSIGVSLSLILSYYHFLGVK